MDRSILGPRQTVTAQAALKSIREPQRRWLINSGPMPQIREEVDRGRGHVPAHIQRASRSSQA